MFFTADQVRNLDEAGLVAFLDRRVSESTGFVDYKLDLSGGKGPDAAARELLKGVSAFANAEGGHLLIGMKDPSKEVDGAAALVGIENGVQIANQIELQCADCIDPRIPGLRALPIPLANGKHAVVVHIPPSPSRPHMVAHQGTKTRTFFIRHSETVQPMKTSEVCQAVLSAAAGSQNAIEYATVQEERYKTLYQFMTVGRCAFVIHATPLVPVDVFWNVTGDEWRNVIAGSLRNGRAMNLSGSNRRPSVEGIVSLNSLEKAPDLAYELHRTGYIGAVLNVPPVPNLAKAEGPYFWGSHVQYFAAFGDLADEAVQTAKSDRPYLLQATIINATGAVLEYDESLSHLVSKPIQRYEVHFPHLRRDSGQSFVEAVAPWTSIFFNAFGIDYKG